VTSEVGTFQTSHEFRLRRNSQQGGRRNGPLLRPAENLDQVGKARPWQFDNEAMPITIRELSTRWPLSGTGEPSAPCSIAGVYLQVAVVKLLPLMAVGLSLSLAACGRDAVPKGDPGPQRTCRPERSTRHSGGGRCSRSCWCSRPKAPQGTPARRATKEIGAKLQP
jgi:hypothetical protein